jgi:predicted PurR-regulated permease PerM
MGVGTVNKSVSSLPVWFQRWGIGAWLVVGMVLVLVGVVWLFETTSSIVDPLIAGFVIGAVSGVLVDKLEQRGLPRAAGAGLLALGLVALAILMVGLVLAAITSQGAHIDASLSTAVDRVESWVKDLGITSASSAAEEIKKAVPEIGRTLLYGVARGISGLTSLIVFLGFTAFTTFFLVKDGPAIGRWIERHMGMQPEEARIVLGDIIQALRRYFLGLTIIAGLTTAGVTIGALIVGVPMLGTIALVTFLASYVPIIGAWTAGIFVFALALAHQGTTAALIMAAIVFVSNGPLQQIVQPIVYGATLRLNALVVFSVTIAAGTLLGIPGMVLAAPLISASVRVRHDLSRLRTTDAAEAATTDHADASGSEPEQT